MPIYNILLIIEDKVVKEYTLLSEKETDKFIHDFNCDNIDLLKDWHPNEYDEYDTAHLIGPKLHYRFNLMITELSPTNARPKTMVIIDGSIKRIGNDSYPVSFIDINQAKFSRVNKAFIDFRLKRIRRSSKMKEKK